MNFIRANIELPKAVQEIFHLIKQFEERAYIAGGFVMDAYTGHDFKDVDIFIASSDQKHNLLRELVGRGISYQTKSDEYSMLEVGEKGVYEFQYQQITFQLVFTNKNERFVEFFDIRMRECYYDGDVAYISSGAMEDIQNKQITFGAITDAASTFYRAIKFEQKYGFTITTNEAKKLSDMLYLTYSKYSLNSFIENDIKEKELKKRARQILDGAILHSFFSRFHNEAAARVLENERTLITSDIFNQLYKKEELYDITKIHIFDENPYLRLIKEKEKDLQKVIVNSLVKSLFDFPLHANEWKKNYKESVYLHTIFKEQIRELIKNHKKDYLLKIDGLFDDIDFLSRKRWNGKPIEIHYSSAEALSIKETIQPYLEDALVHIGITDYGRIIYNFKEKKEIRNDLRNLEYELIKPFIQADIEALTDKVLSKQ